MNRIREEDLEIIEITNAELKKENRELGKKIAELSCKAKKELAKEIAKNIQLEQKKENLIKFLEDTIRIIEQEFTFLYEDKRDNASLEFYDKKIEDLTCLKVQRNTLQEILEKVKSGKYE